VHEVRLPEGVREMKFEVRVLFQLFDFLDD
jgi:hypothetical protein